MTALVRGTVVDVPVNPFEREPATALRVETDGGLLVRDGVIVERGDFSALRAAHPDEPVTDARGGESTASAVWAEPRGPPADAERRLSLVTQPLSARGVLGTIRFPGRAQ